jgi:pyruvate dehydrogenase E1 component alpha subunit
LSVDDVAMRAASYNMPGVTVDGIDVVAVYETMSEAVRRARAGQGPTLIECKTFRWRAHSEQRGNPQDPRPREAVEQAQRHDPIVVFADKLQAQGIATAADLQRLHDAVAAAVDEAIAFAKASPLPRPEDALTDVFAS